MRTMIWSAVVAVCMALTMSAAAAREQEQAVLIDSFEALCEFSETVEAGDSAFTGEVRLIADIRADGTFVPIGSPEHMFNGIFDGQGHTVSGLRVDTAGEFAGLFGYVGMDGSVKNLRLEHAYVSGARYVGGIAGYNAGTIENCAVYAGWVNCPADMQYAAAVGGVAGLSGGSIVGCGSFDLRVSGCSRVGGIAGSVCGGVIRGCISTGSVFARSDEQASSGGIAGEVRSGGALLAGICTARVSAPRGSWAGGVAGALLSGEMKGCISFADVTGREAGALAGCTAKRAQVIRCAYVQRMPGAGEGRQTGMIWMNAAEERKFQRFLTWVVSRREAWYNK